MDHNINKKNAKFPKSISELRSESYYNISNESTEFLEKLKGKFIFMYDPMACKIQCLIYRTCDEISFHVQEQSINIITEHSKMCIFGKHYTIRKSIAGGPFFIPKVITDTIKNSIIVIEG